MNQTLLTKKQALARQFPNLWMSDGEDFSSGHENTIWTGEGSTVNDYNAFDYYGYSNTHGVHPKLAQALEKLGLYADFYDPGTVFFYPK